MKIKVKYRNKWYYANAVNIDKEGNVYFNYLHDLDGAVDSEHIQDFKIIIEGNNEE